MSENLYLEAWNYALESLKNEYISKDREAEFLFNFNINYVEDNDNIITSSVPSAFMKTIVTNKGSLKILENKIKEITGLNNIIIDCIVKKDSAAETKDILSYEGIKSEEKTVKSLQAERKNENTENYGVKSVSKHPLLKEDYTFETFIPGDGNRFAYNAAINVAENPGKEKNPILFYGGSGLGKTHLMESIGNYIYQKNPELKICYISAESFTNEFLDSIRTKKTQEFKNKFRNLDVLLLDDIHFLQGKESTQEELFYTFNALYDQKHQMVFTCDRPIKETKNMAARLVSRLTNGLCIDLQPPTYEDRLAILQKKVELSGKFIEPSILDYIAKNIETNVRDLEAALNKITGYSEFVGQNLTLEVVKNLLKDLISTNNAENISLDIIEKVIAENYLISVSELKGKKKEKKYVIPRQIAIYIARELTEVSYMELGAEFGKDHSTIMHAYTKISEQIKIDPSYETKIEQLIRDIKEYKSK